MASGETGSLKDVIFSESMRKARIIDSSSYQFPERLPRMDWIISAIVFVVVLVITFTGYFW
jgi:hypothetical protein